MGAADEVALLDGDAKGVTWSDRTGKVLARIPAKGTGYVLDSPADLAFDMFQHLYVLDRSQVVIFAPGGRHVATFTPDAQSGFKSGAAMALDQAARLYIYDDSQARVLIYQ